MFIIISLRRAALARPQAAPSCRDRRRHLFLPYDKLTREKQH